MKHRLAQAELKTAVPCADCGRGLEVPAPGHHVPQASSAACLCGAVYRVYVPTLGRSGAGLEIALERVR